MYNWGLRLLVRNDVRRRGRTSLHAWVAVRGLGMMCGVGTGGGSSVGFWARLRGRGDVDGGCTTGVATVGWWGAVR